MIDRYIKELLNEHHRVIVPDLGAFLYKGETSRTMYFNEFLRFNDGLLLNYIAEQGKIDKIEAAKQIKAYVEETNKNLQARKKVTIQGIGYIYLDENDKIQLHPEATQGLQTEEPQSKPSFTLEEPHASETVETIIIPPQRPASETPSEITPPMSFDFSDQTKPEIRNESQKPVFQAPPATNVKSASRSGRKTPPPPKAKSNRTIIWIASIVVLIIISLLYLFIIKPIYKDKQSNKKAFITSANLDTIVDIAKDSQNKIEPREKTIIPQNASGNKKYYLVAGCFVQENNADKVVQKLSNEGFSPEKFAKIEKMYFVSIASFGDKASAEKQLRELKAKGYKDLWIKYY